MGTFPQNTAPAAGGATRGAGSAIALSLLHDPLADFVIFTEPHFELVDVMVSAPS